MQLTSGDIAVRLAVAAIAGGALGLNRDLHGKAAGVRTLGIVSLGAASIALIVPLSMPDDTSALARVIQGLVMAIGFLGAGVIVHDSSSRRVHGLTTAACSWFAVAVGIMCGTGLWQELIVAFTVCIALLLFGGRIERRINRASHREPPDSETDSET